MDDRIASVIFWSHVAGLANRLRALVGYQAMAAILGVPFYLCWEESEICDSSFQQLFDRNEIEIITPRQMAQLRRATGTRVFDDVPHYSEIWHMHLAQVGSWESFRALAVRFLRHLRPIPAIRTVIEEYSAHNALDTRYGLNIRMTDNVNAYTWWTHNSSRFQIRSISRVQGFEAFIQQTIRNAPAATFFLATDNSEINHLFLSEFSGHLIAFPKSYRRPKRRVLTIRQLGWRTRDQATSTIREALIDLWLLSKCQSIVGTYYSSFSEVAAILGNRPHHVVMGDRIEESPGVAELTGPCEQS